MTTASLCRTILASLALGAIPACSGVVQPGPGPDPLANYQAAAQYSRERNGFAVLVWREGQVVFEDYENESGNPGGPDVPHRLASGTKSFWGVAAAAAVEDGIFQLDETVADTLTEWQTDPLKSRITVRQLLSLTSGLDQGGAALQGPDVIDKFDYAVNQLGMDAAPGEAFSYGPGPFEAFGAFLGRKLASRGDDPLSYLTRRVLLPIGLAVASWRRDGAGNPLMAAGAFLTAREWAKLGELVMNGGAWEGRQVVDAEILAECFQGTTANPAYGLTWWLNEPGLTVVQQGDVWVNHSSTPVLPDLVPDLVRAMGHGKQRLYVIPSRSMVIVRFGESEATGWSDRVFLALLFGN